MQTAINEKISVLILYDKNKGMAVPKKIKWRGRVHDISQIGYHHKTKQGQKLWHIFSVCSQNMAFRLKLDTDNLHWTLEEVSDGSAG